MTAYTTVRGATVRLRCGCVATRPPQIGNPPRWWCRTHQGWQPRKKT